MENKRYSLGQTKTLPVSGERLDIIPQAVLIKLVALVFDI